uniref:Uncharacterized protein n=1 Tax=Arundo donax TaxID=35708 RepID=A0A0A9H5A8_ARUDO
MASGLLSPVLSSASKLLDLLRSRPAASCPPCGGRSTVSADVQRLERLLRRIQATLDDAAEREVRDSSVKLWIEELTDLARDAEDVLDDYRYDLLRRRVQEHQGAANTVSTSGKRKHDDEENVGICERIRKITRRFEISTDRAALQLRPDDEDGGISERIGEITRRFEEISTDRAALHLGPEDGVRIAGRDHLWESRATSYLLDESLVFGRTEEKDRIIELVLSCSLGTGTQVLPVVGMGGIGKTTMAQMVYNDGRVQETFDLRGWVHVSQTFDLVRLTTAITESLTKKSCGFNEFSNIHDVLKEEINAKSVFLVLDDVWNGRESCWQDLLSPLKFAQTVTILVTTRYKEVARPVQTVKPFFLGLLPEDHCWLLFRCYAFGDRSIDEESSLVQVGRKIMQKCGGLPLAVKSIGCLLRSKMDMRTWIEISQSEFWEYSDDNEEIFSALRLSFYRLPARLKPCFLLCTLYCKGEAFTKNDMIHLWIAHGYIQPTRFKTPEKVAGEYFDELYERSLIETDLELCDGRQYMKNPIARSSAKLSSDQLLNASQNFDVSHVRSLVEVFRGKKTKNSSDQLHLPFQRFRLHDMIWDLAKSLSSYFLSVRDDKGSLNEANILLQGNGISRENSQWDHVRNLKLYDSSFRIIGVYKFKYLRALVLKFSLCLHSIYGIRNLKHLRYLHVNVSCFHERRRQRICNTLKRLPETICHLYSLEKLIISIVQEFSIKSCNLISLRYLHLSFQFNDWSPLQLSELYNLDTLCLRSCGAITELPLCIGNLVNLRRLNLSKIPNIKKLNHDSFRWQNNNNKFYLRKVVFPALEELECDNLYDVRDWCGVQASDCPKIQSITIRNCYKLRRIPYFASVRELILSNLAITDLQLSVYNVPSQLQTLDIRDCQNLNSLMGLENLCSLGSLYIARCPELVFSRKKKLLYKPHHVFIDDCFGLMEWCDEQKLHYQVPEMVKMSHIKRAKECGVSYFQSFEHLCLDICPEKGRELILSPNNWFPSELRLLKFGLKRARSVPSLHVGAPTLKRLKNFDVSFPTLERLSSPTLERLKNFDASFPTLERLENFHVGFPTLGRLEIRGCPKLVALIDLDELNTLHSLVIADCPVLYILPEMKFPLWLTSLTIDGCHKLLSLPLNLSRPSVLIDLQVSDCQGLVYIGGLECLGKLESLVLLHCPLLQLQELLPGIPESVTVFLCPKLKKWCEIQSIEHQESVPDSSHEVDA